MTRDDDGPRIPAGFNSMTSPPRPPRSGIESIPPERGSRRSASVKGGTGVRLVGGLIAVAAWLLVGWAANWSYLGGPNMTWGYGVVPYIALGVLAVLAGRRADRVAAWLIYLGGIIGATAVAWAAGPVGVAAGAAPELRAGYFTMLVIIAAGISVVVGLFVVWGGYWLGRQAKGDRPPNGLAAPTP